MSTGTNRERIEQNNLKLEEIKSKIGNLPEYQDIKPIYSYSDFTARDIPAINSSCKIYYATMLYPYVAIGFKSNSGSNIQPHIYKINDDGTVTKITTNLLSDYDDYFSFIGYDDTCIYFCITGSRQSSYTIQKVYLSTGNVVNTAHKVTTINTYTKLTNVGNMYFVRKGSSSDSKSVLYRYDPESGIKSVYTFSGYENLYCLNQSGFYKQDNIVYKITTNFESNTVNVIKGSSIPNLACVNRYGNKVICTNGIYSLTDELGLGEKLNSCSVLSTLRHLGEDYYCDGEGKLYTFDEDTNTLSQQYKINLYYGLLDSASLRGQPVICSYTQLYTFTKTNNTIGFKYEGEPYYYKNNSSDLNSDKLLIGNNAYTRAGQSISGTMPNNGALNYTPSTEQQTIPAGYTSGGKVAGDTNLTSNNIKLGVSIFGVEGNLEADKPDQTKSVTPTTEEQVITPDTGYELASVTVEAVTNSIDSNIVAENIKKDVSILGVTGTLEAGGGTVEGIKQFSTIEEMNSSVGNKEGDLAVVYRSEMQNIKDGDIITSITFPKTVTFDTAITTSYSSRLRNSTAPRIDLDIQLSSTNFRISDSYGTIPTINYTSSDGITYTRTATSEETYEIGETTISGVDEHICKFMQVDGMSFDGLFEYQRFNDKNKLVMYGGLYYDSGTKYTDEYILNDYSVKVKPLLNTISALHSFIRALLLVYKDGKLYVYGTEDNTVNGLIVNTLDKYCVGVISKNSSTTVYKYELNPNEGTYTEQVLTNSTPSYSDSTYKYFDFDDITGSYVAGINSSDIDTFYSTVWLYYKDSTRHQDNFTNKIGVSIAYLTAPTQLSATPDYVYAKEFYGSNGVEVGTLGTPDNSFMDINAELVYKIQNAYNDMEPRVLTDDDKTIDKNIYFIPVKRDGTPLLDTSRVTNMGWMFYDCTNLTEIPQLDTSSVTDMTNMLQNCTNLTTIPQLNTSSVTDMNSMFSGCTNLATIPQLDTSSVTNMTTMFYNCTNLTTIPLLDTSSVTGMNSMFKYCTSLSDESLNNILAMCANATSYRGTKTLKQVGLTSAQAAKCKSLSNYSAFTAAGWTTGY